MYATAAALFFAHVLADYVLQTTWMTLNKGRAGGLSAHTAVVFATAIIALGGAGLPWIVGLSAVHAATDFAKSRLDRSGTLAAHVADQAVHLATIAVVATLAPGMFSQGIWPAVFTGMAPHLPQIFLVTGLAIYAIEAGGYGIALLLKHFPAGTSDTGAPVAGRRIGQLERAVVFLLVLADQPAAIAFLIAAKSVLRFGDLSDDRIASEYVIVGTLASVLWAMLCGYAAVLLLPEASLEMLRPSG